MTGEDFERYYAGHIRFALRRSGAACDRVEETCQDVFLKCRHWEERYRRTHPRVATVVKWAKRVHWSRLRKQQREEQFRAEYGSRAQSQRRQGAPMLFEESDKADPALAMEKRELLSLLRSAVDALPPSLRAVAKLRAEGLSHEQIARTLAITVGASKLRFLYARRELTNMLQRHFRD